MREMRGEGLSLLSYNTAKQLNNCILHQVNLGIWGCLVQSPAPGRRPVVSWPHGSSSQGHSLSPRWNADVQREVVLSTNNVITRSSLLVNNSLKTTKKIRFKAIARTCLIMRCFSGRSEKQFPTALGRPREHRWLSLPPGGLEMEPCRLSEGSAHPLPTGYSGPSATLPSAVWQTSTEPSCPESSLHGPLFLSRLGQTVLLQVPTSVSNTICSHDLHCIWGAPKKTSVILEQSSREERRNGTLLMAMGQYPLCLPATLATPE